MSKRSLILTHPELAREWHPTKNKLTPYNVSAGSVIKVWWRCDKSEDHEWEAYPNTRTTKIGGRNIGCPCCAGKKVVKSNCLVTTHPEIAINALTLGWFDGYIFI